MITTDTLPQKINKLPEIYDHLEDMIIEVRHFKKSLTIDQREKLKNYSKRTLNAITELIEEI